VYARPRRRRSAARRTLSSGDSTGWLAHTTRAALTGLRKRGYAVAIDRSNNERGSFYRTKAEDDGGPVARCIEELADSLTPRKPAQRLLKPRARRAA
jgi:Protein of unknown function (DUF3489)